MFKTKVEGTAHFADEEFSFSGGYAQDTHVIPNEIKLRGTLRVAQNADVTFHKDATSISAPPMMKTILKTDTVTIKRSNRNYVITTKYPIVQSNDETQAMITTDRDEILKAIEEDRKSVQDLMN